MALRQRDLRLLLSAGLVSLTGDWVLNVGLAYSVYALTGSTLASAVMLVCSFVPQIVLGSVAGVFVDRWRPRRTMITTNLLLAVGLLPLLMVHRPGQIWLVYAVAAWEGSVQQFFIPAEQCLIPHIVDESNLVTANALGGQNRDVARLAGSALGGVLAAAGGITLLALVDAASFFISALLVLFVRDGRVSASGPGPQGRLRRLSVDWVDGLRLSARHRVLRTIMIFLLITSVGQGIMSTLFAPFARSVLHADAGTYGLIVAAQAIGGIVGGLWAASIGSRLNAASALGWAAICFGVLDLVLFVYPLVLPVVWPAIVLMVLVGFPGALNLAAAITMLQCHAGEAHLGRVFGALSTVEGLAIVAGTIAAGYLAQMLGIVAMLAVQGAGYVLAGMLAVVLLRHDRVPGIALQG